jgi:CheY-like chemotaxis protein
VHDVNQLLWVILGQASLLPRRDDAAQVAASASRITAAAQDAAALLRGLLGEPSAPVIGDLAECDLAAAAHAAWQQSTDLATARGGNPAAATLQVPSGAAPRVAASALTVRRILANLFINALEAMPAGGVVTCRWQVDAALAHLEVSDTGPGLPPPIAAAVFTPGVSRSKADGHGLGLAGCRQLARDLGGELALSATGPTGAVFRLSLPLAGAVTPVRPLRILAVDDEATVREMLREWLGAEGHAVTVAGDRDAALAVFAADRFDVVLVDVRLPGASGHDLAADLRARDPAVAVILITGWGAGADLPPPDAACVDFTGAKPLDLPQLHVLLQRAATLCARRREA